MLLPHLPPVALLPDTVGMGYIPSANGTYSNGSEGEVKSPLPNALGRGFRGGVNQRKSRGVLYVAPDGTATRALPVLPCTDPLEQITSVICVNGKPVNELAPSCNLREWLLWKVLNMSTNDYVIVPHINAIVARISVTKHSTGTRAYCIMHNGNITALVGQSHEECLVKVMTWLGCVCAAENTIEKAHAAYLFQHWCSHFGTGIRPNRREEFLTTMLNYESEPLCIQRPGLFYDMPLWELLIPQLRYGQFTVVNELCAILARPARDTYWLLYNNHVLEYVREIDDDGKFEQTSDELREELIEKVRLLIRLQNVGA